MSGRRRRPAARTARPAHRAAPRRAQLLRLALAAMLGVAAALLVACGSSNGKLIPVADSGPLQGDFETVAQAAESGNGSCSATETALAKTEQDFNTVPGSVDSGLRDTLRQGIDNLRKRALALCAQPLAQKTPTSTTPKPITTTSTSTATTPTTTPSTTPTTSTPTNTTPTTPATPGGGTPAGPSEGTPGAGSEQGGTGAGEGNGEGPAGGGAGAGGLGAGGQEVGK